MSSKTIQAKYCLYPLLLCLK